MRTGNDEVIIEVALNGMTVPETNRTVPRTPQEVAAQGLQCLEAGAAIVHSHPVSQAAEESLQEYVDAWRPVIAERPDALLYPTARIGGPEETVVETWAHNVELGRLGLCRMSLVDPGSVNLGMSPDGSVAEPFLDTAYVNTHQDTLYKLQQSDRHRLAPSISIFDPSFLRSAVTLQRAGRIPPGAMLKLFFGEDDTFGLRPTEKALEAYLELMDGTGFTWSAGVLGGDVFAGDFAELVLARGGHLRVGLEDLNGPGSRTNLELVQQAVSLVRASGRDVASPARAAALLAMPAARTQN